MDRPVDDPDHIVLRPYQVEAVKMGVDRLAILLALTMGAGKTGVALRIIRELREEEPGLQVAIFCTNSLKFQWLAEIKKFDPGATAIVIDGKDKQRRQARYSRIGLANYTILSYDMLIHDWDLVRTKLPIDGIICDEVTLIKGFTAKRSKRLKYIAKRSPIRMGLSGQPVENKPEELFSIMEFVDPDFLGPFHKFDRTFIRRDRNGKVIKYVNLDVLHEKMKEVMFRRSREDIAEFLPEKNETDLAVPLDDKTEAVYRFIVEDILKVIDEAMASGAGGGFDLLKHYGRGDHSQEDNWLKGQIMSRITCMRLLTSHPSLLLKSADDFDDETTKTGSSYASVLKDAGVLDMLPDSSPKLEALFEKIQECMEEGDDTKMVIFSGFKPMLKIIGAHLREKQIGYTSMTGDTSAVVRDERRMRFNTDPTCRVFLSSDAGAYGVNLDAGTHLINYDLPWSAGKLAQRVARIDRTSSKHAHIEILYLYTAGTIEQRQFNMLTEKIRIADAFVDGKGIDKLGDLQLELGSLRAFLEGEE